MWLGVPCDHCGRCGAVLGQLSHGNRYFYLCHAEPDGRKANPDCYTLVTHGREHLGSRRMGYGG